LGAAAYSKAVDFIHDRQGRIEAGLEGAEDRGRTLADDAFGERHPDNEPTDASLRGFSDASVDGVLDAADGVSPEYRESFYRASKVLDATREPSAFGEITDTRRATETGFDKAVSERCEAQWGYPSAAAARNAGILEPLVPDPDIVATPEMAADTESSAEPLSVGDSEHAAEGTTDLYNAQSVNIDGSEAPVPPPAGAVESDLGAEPDSAPVVSVPAAVSGDTYATGDGDLAAQDQGHEAWVEAEAAEDTALAASAAAVDEPTAYDDPETYTGDGDMKALTEAYDWEAEQFDKGATLFDEPATDTMVIMPEQPVAVPDAEAREPDEPEV
jgi:hypothetical protein